VGCEYSYGKGAFVICGSARRASAVAARGGGGGRVAVSQSRQGGAAVANGQRGGWQWRGVGSSGMVGGTRGQREARSEGQTVRGARGAGSGLQASVRQCSDSAAARRGTCTRPRPRGHGLAAALPPR
jgi:hypothetical protein